MLRRGESIDGGSPADEDVALVRLLHAGEQAHQRGFARAVLAEQHVDFAGMELEGHGIERDDAGEALRDPAQRRHDPTGRGESADRCTGVSVGVIRFSSAACSAAASLGYFGGAATEVISARTLTASKVGSTLQLAVDDLLGAPPRCRLQTCSGMYLECSKRTESSASWSG